MSTSTHTTKRVAQNTLFLYFRTFLVMAISIFTSRIVLDALGVEDYGIYNVVGGFVSMFSVLSGTLTAGSQRFLSYELGKEKNNIKRIFSTIVSIHIFLAIIIFTLLETFGLWFLNCKMVISPDRLIAANWVFQCSVITFCINLICIPYNATIIAYEKMSAFAYISIFEVSAKLACVYALYIISFDSLIVYAFSMLLIALSLRILYSSYCHRKFSECRYSFNYDRQTFKDILSFCGWNFIGSTAAILNGQGINMLTNLFFGVTMNAAKGIATQVGSAIDSFVNNFMLALNPQITKSYAAKDYGYVNMMIIRGTKFAFFLFLIICLPVLLNTEFILGIWLKKVPEHACEFVRLAIIYTMSQTLSQCLYTTMLATGHIKKYQIIVGSLSLFAFPVAYIFFKLNLSAEFGYVSMIIFSIVCLIARLFLLQEMVPHFSGYKFFTKVIVRCLLTILPLTAFCIYTHFYYTSVNLQIFLVESMLSIILSCLSILLLGINKEERLIITCFALKRIFKKDA